VLSPSWTSLVPFALVELALVAAAAIRRVGEMGGLIGPAALAYAWLVPVVEGW
jgi:hypothetical protein